jgi:hypothetical protein
MPSAGAMKGMKGMPKGGKGGRMPQVNMDPAQMVRWGVTPAVPLLRFMSSSKSRYVLPGCRLQLRLF